MVRRHVFVALGFAVAASLAMGALVGCASEGGASSVAASSSTSSAASAALSSASSSATESGSAQAERADSGQGEFNSALVGTWHVYSLKSSKVNGLQVNASTMAALRSFGVHETLTFYHDGTFDMDMGGGKVETFTWEETGYNQFALAGKDDEDAPIAAKLESGRLIFDVDTKDNDYGIVTLTYSK